MPNLCATCEKSTFGQVTVEDFMGSGLHHTWCLELHQWGDEDREWYDSQDPTYQSELTTEPKEN
jgi:hypothetical protein